ncbi:hypothetical protein [Enterobacter chengduensis]|uniref:hypothetical protein n=1 Tax=Enterobacter chengduensis TaxID=2494701 RepID=UPI002003DEDD|nr:hypothetical protein [Enterobacter chengduensis]MCK7427409.1 hypothetical protein [Enterobacter chengduensis]
MPYPAYKSLTPLCRVAASPDPAYKNLTPLCRVAASPDPAYKSLTPLCGWRLRLTRPTKI